MAFAANLLPQSNVCLSLGNIRTKTVRLDRGVLRGAADPPFRFILVTEMALASLHESWTKRGFGCLVDGLWLPNLACADDVMLQAMSIIAALGG